MQRRTFVQAAAGSGAVAAAVGGPLGAAAAPAPAERAGELDTVFRDRFLAAAEAAVDGVLTAYPAQIAGLWQHRAMARSALRLAAVWVTPQAHRHHDPVLAAAITELVAALRAAQHADGTWDQGNLHTPPDSAFVVNDLCGLLTLLGTGSRQETRAVRDDLRALLRSAGRALAHGGVHTPNHRYEVSAALARLQQLVPHPDQTARIEQWLAEGVDVDADGQYSERSPNYAFGVTNPCLLAIARHTGRVELRGIVRRNLDLHLLCLDDDGRVESVQSRRQDQRERKDVADGLLQFRELAQRDGDGRYAAVVLDLLERDDTAARAGDADVWAELLLHPDLLAPLPQPVAAVADGVRVLAGSGLVRARRGRSTLTVFGGTDFADDPARPGPVASGLSTNPTFLRYRRGAAVLDSVRFVPRFFSLGHFRPDGVSVVDGGWSLHQRVSANYWQPLPPERRRAEGDYELTSDGRYWSSLSFDERERDQRVLETTVVVRPAGDLGAGLDLAFAVTGTEEDGDVPAVVELAFAGDGVLSGTVVVAGASGATPAVHQLVDGWGTWTVGDDVLRFGPGTGSGPRQPAVVDAGERYSWLGGNLTPAGTRVLLTTTVPRTWTLSVR